MKSITEELAGLIARSDKILTFTGAGISTESGISDYRSKGGLWDRFQPVTIQEFVSSEEKRIKYWQRKFELYESMQASKPNEGHFAIADIERIGKLRGLVTQNIDGLHQLAGISADKILEIHGSNRETICLDCGELTSWQEAHERLKDGEKTLDCKTCGGMLKPNTISFGQSLSPIVLQKSVEWSRTCDLFICLGSSLVVEPAASLPRIAKQGGAGLVIITRSQTPLDAICDIKIEYSIGEVLSKIMKELKR